MQIPSGGTDHDHPFFLDVDDCLGHPRRDERTRASCGSIEPPCVYATYSESVTLWLGALLVRDTFILSIVAVHDRFVTIAIVVDHSHFNKRVTRMYEA